MREKFLIDVDKCSGCGLCIVACKDEHVENSYAPWTAPQPATGHFWIDVIPVERGKLPRVKMSYLPLLCQHCEDAPCIPACSTGAVKLRDDGLVWIDPALCNGCGECMKACPYDVIYINEEQKIAQKCTGCAHRADMDLQPRCAEVCPHDAIVFSSGTDRVLSEGADEFFHPEYGTKPRVAWKGLPRPWIAGNTIDPVADEVVSGAIITVTVRSTGSTQTVRSSEFGDFYVTGLGSDLEYDVEIRCDGYVDVNLSVRTAGDQDLGAVEMKRRSGLVASTDAAD